MNENKEFPNKESFNDKMLKFISDHISLVFVIFTLIVIILPNLFARCSIFPFFKPDRSGLSPNEIGDAIGGMTAPIVGLFSAFRVYIAFREQKKANDELIKFNKSDLKIKNYQYANDLLKDLKTRSNKLIFKYKTVSSENIFKDKDSILEGVRQFYHHQIKYSDSNLNEFQINCRDFYEFLILITKEIKTIQIDTFIRSYFLNSIILQFK